MGLQTVSSDDDFITPKPSAKHRKTIKPKKIKTTSTSAATLSSAPADPSDVPKQTIAFLNSLTNDVARDFSREYIEEQNLSKLINPKNLEGCTVEQLVELKAFDERNGNFSSDSVKLA